MAIIANINDVYAVNSTLAIHLLLQYTVFLNQHISQRLFAII